MQVAVSSSGEPDSYALLLLLEHLADSGRLVRHFVCCECRGLVNAVHGWKYLHTCEGGHHAGEGALSAEAASTAKDADLAALV